MAEGEKRETWKQYKKEDGNTMQKNGNRGRDTGYD